MTVNTRRPELEATIWEAVHRHERRLIVYTTRILRDADRARDVVQEAFIRLCRDVQTVDPPRVLPWLYAVCRNRARDVIKKEKRMVPLDDGEAALEVSRLPTPPAAAEHREDAHQVLEAMKSLSQKQEEVLRLRFQGGLSNAEISNVTGLTKNHVGFLVHKGLAALRTRFMQGRVVEQRS